MVSIVVATTLIVFSILIGFTESLREGDCEVCISVLDKFSDSLDDDVSQDARKIEGAFKRFCKATKGVENKFCHLLGALDEPMNGILGEMSKSLSRNVSADKVCERLKKKQICDLRYEKILTLKNVDLRKLKVRDLKKILNYWNEKCEECAEQEDYIQRIEELKPKYVRDEL